MEKHLTNQQADADLQARRADIRRRLAQANTAAIVILLLVICLTGAAVLQAIRAENNAREAARELDRARQAEARALRQRAEVRRRAGEVGQRLESLAAIAEGARFDPSPALCDEAIAALALPDLKFVPLWTNESAATFMQFNHSLSQLALGKASGEIKFLDFQAGREQSTIPSIGSPVRRLWFSPDDQFIAARYGNGSNLVWSVTTRLPVRGWDEKFSFAGFSSDGNCGFVTDNSGGLHCFRLMDGEQLWRRDGGQRVVLLDAAPRGDFFALFLAEGSDVQVRKFQNGELVRELPGRSPPATLAWSSDGQILFIGRLNGSVEAWDTATWQQATEWRGHDASVVEVRCDPLSRYIASASWDGTIRFWSFPDFRLLMSAPGYGAHMIAQFSPDGRQFACSRVDKIFGILEETPSPVLTRILVSPGDGRGTWSLDVSPDGALLAAGYEDGLRVFDASRGNQLAFQTNYDCRSALFTPNGQSLVTCGASGLALWPLERAKSGEHETVSLGPRQVMRAGPLTYASLTADGEWVAAGDPTARSIQFHNLHQPTNNFSLGTHVRIQDVAFSPGGRWAASGTWYGRGVKVWDVAARRDAIQLPIEGSAAVTFSPNESLLVTSGREYRIWECGSWHELYRTAEIGAVLPPCAFSPDAHLLALLKGPRTIEVREASTGRILGALESPGSSPLTALRFTPDANKLIVLEWTRQIQVWDLTAIRMELARLGLDWKVASGGQGHSKPALAQSSLGARASLASRASHTSAWFYALTLAALLVGVGIGLYMLRYHQRMMQGYDEVEGVAAERNRALNVAQAELLHSQKMRALGTLAAGIAHDFNNLLSIIRMGNNFLARPGVSAVEKAESHRAIESAVDQGRKIVRGMLGYSREPSDETETYSVLDVVNEAGLLLNQQFLRGITLTLELDKDIPPVTGRRARLQQILLNLIVNAAEAMNGAGRLRIAVRRNRLASGGLVVKPVSATRYVQLILEDTGPGIDAAIRERVFEPFFSTKPQGASSGTGLGLSLVHSLAEQEGMGISLESTGGVGTTFTIWIPVTEEPGVETLRSAPARDTARTAA